MAPPLHSFNDMQPLIIFTDLDGTLLDHDSYSWQAAEPALRRIDECGIPLILNTSKTFVEVSQLREALGNHHPFVIENGGGACIPAGYFEEEAGEALQIFGLPYRDIIKVLAELRTEKGFSFRGFSDMTAADVAAATDLSCEDAERAKDRCCSEPIVWMDSEENFDTFCSLLETHDLQVISGGRFFHVMGKTDKGRAMHWLLDIFKHTKGSDLVTIALGDSPNDRPMLEQADHAVVIRNKGASLSLERIENVIYTREPGPAGWQSAIDELLDRLGG